MRCCSIRALDRDGLEGSFGIFGLWVGLAGILPITIGMPESDRVPPKLLRWRKGCLWMWAETHAQLLAICAFVICF